ncbi:MAG: 6-carboxytetrahydropterin synthase [Candidatus Kapabacteria bacterium]|nr:6-carboxytetrahydropterin synthase [Candidatus Kapabacteria bacterium]
MHTTRIAKDFRWEMGHRLPFHTGLCKNIHGHSYTLRVELEGTTDNNGMVMDFYDINAAVDPIVESLDHCFICDEDDSVMIEFFLTNPMKVTMVPFSTTAENICRWLCETIWQEMQAHERINSITCRLHETERAYAQYSVTR